MSGDAVMRLYIDRYKNINSHKLASILFVILALALASIFVHGYANIGSRYNGPVVFGVSTFLLLGVGLCFLMILAFTLLNRSRFISLVLIFASFLARYLMPYYVFGGYVNYDTPIHYLSALYLRDFGLKPGYYYYSWPSWFILNDMYNTVSGLEFPVDSSVVALVSRFLIPLFIYLVSRRFLSSAKSLLVAMMVLLVFEPFIVHPCPQITAVALTITAITAFLNWFHGHDHRWLYALLILGISIATYHAIMPISLTLSVLVVLVLYGVFPRLGIVKADMLTRYENSKMWLVLAVLIAVVVFYNIYITIFVTRSIIKTLELIIRGGEARLDVYSLTIENPELKWQYDVITNIGRAALFLLLGTPSAIVALSLLIKYLESKLSITERAFFAIAVVAGINALLFIVFSTILQTGLVERFYQISYITSPTLTAYLYENTTNVSTRKPGIRDLRKAASFIVIISTFTFIPLSMFTAPSYINLYADAFGEPEIAVARWIAAYVSLPQIHLDGSGRLNQLTALYLYLRNVLKINLGITRYIEVKALEKDFIYPSGTLVTTRKPLSLGAATIKGLSDTILNKHIADIPKHLDKIFSSNICDVFVSG